MLKIKKILQGIKQRLYYIKHYKKGFDSLFLLPGFLRSKIGDNLFFKKLTKDINEIKLTTISNDIILLHAGNLNFVLPKSCFYEGDFFDIVYPYLNLKYDIIDTLVYKNPYYESEGCYENFGCNIGPDDYIIDAGANVGLFSIVASKKLRQGKVFAFEPLATITSVFKENVKNNKCKNIIIENLVLGDSTQNVNFYHDLEKNYNASSTTIKTSKSKTVVLKQITLDEYVQINKIEKVDFIKADIEGSERNLLRGAKDTIQRFSPKLSIRTYHLPDDKEILYNIVKEFNPNYKIILHKKTLYAWV